MAFPSSSSAQPIAVHGLQPVVSYALQGIRRLAAQFQSNELDELNS